MEYGSGTEDQFRRRLHQERIKELFQQPFLMFVAAIVITAALNAYMFSDIATHQQIAIWLGSMYLVHFARVVQILAFRRKKSDEINIQRWELGYLVLVATNGALWGMLAFYLQAQNETQIFFYTLIISGLVAGSMPILSYSLPIYISFILTSGLPFIIQLFYFNTKLYVTIAILAIIFVLTNIVSARNNQKKIQQRACKGFN